MHIPTEDLSQEILDELDEYNQEHAAILHPSVVEDDCLLDDHDCQ